MDPVTKRHFKDELFAQFATIGKALSSGRRLELLELLAQAERPVEELARETGMSVANASQHLQVLRAARLVEVRRDGLFAYYRLAGDRVFLLWQTLRDLGTSRLAEVDRLVGEFLDGRAGLAAVSAEDLRKRLKAGDVVLLDVRPREEYAAGHIPGALSIPVAELRKRLRELPRDQRIVAYCRGPYCVFADEAVFLLRSRGYDASRLEGGFPDWQASGFHTTA